MALLIKFSTEKWWLCWILFMGLVAKAGYDFGIIGIAVSLGIGKVLKDLFQIK
jgi:hypothetical protein